MTSITEVPLQLPLRLRLPAGSGQDAANGSSSQGAASLPTDVVDVQVPQPGRVFTVEAGDRLSVRELFDTDSTTFTSIARWRVALRDDPTTPAGEGGQLLLRGQDVTGKLDFTPAEFIELQYVAGADGSATDLVVVARNGTLGSDGSLSGTVDSMPLQITAQVGETRSIEAAGALRNTVGADEANVVRLAQDSALYAGLGKGRPALATVGNFTAEAGDCFSVRELYGTGNAAFTSIARWRVALRDDPSTPASEGGRLLLRGRDVTGQVDFTPAEFIELQYIAGSSGSASDLVVVARNGKTGSDGTLGGIVDSPAVQITASVTGTRSLNAAAALRSEAGADEADVVRLAQDSALYAGIGQNRPALTTVGNFTAEAGDRFSVRELYGTGDTAFTSVARWRVALRNDPSTPAGEGGRLLLRGQDVTRQVDFTPAEFIELQYIAGSNGSASDLVVVARNGKAGSDGTLSGIVDSPAVQITARVTGTRSINAAAALRSDAGTAEAGVVRLAQDAALFSGLGKSRPVLEAVVARTLPDVPTSPEALTGAAQSNVTVPGSTDAALDAYDLSPLFPAAIGASRSTAPPQAPGVALVQLLALLGQDGTGGAIATAGDTTPGNLLLQAYLKMRG